MLVVILAFSFPALGWAAEPDSAALLRISQLPSHTEAILSFLENRPAEQQQGLQTYFRADGKTKLMEIPWDNGCIQGLVRIYHPEGQLAAALTFVNDTLHGEAATYWPDGAILTRGKYRQGKAHGAALHHTSDGQLFARSLYHNGISVRETRVAQP